MWILCSGIEVPVAKGELSDWLVDHLGFVLGWEGDLLWQEFGFYLRCWPRSRSQRGRNEEFGRARLPSGTDSQRPGTARRFGPVLDLPL